MLRDDADEMLISTSMTTYLIARNEMMCRILGGNIPFRRHDRPKALAGNQVQSWLRTYGASSVGRRTNPSSACDLDGVSRRNAGSRNPAVRRR